MPTSISERRFRLTIAYDGSDFSGWQIQPHCVTIQSSIEDALAVIVKHPCKIHGSGRTDQGVHAQGQVAHVDLITRMPPAIIARALNGRLPGAIRIVSVRNAAPAFHARRDATSKEYRYHVVNSALMPPHRRLYALHAPRPLAIEPMRRAAAYFRGTHDFVSFMANPNRDVESSVRTITRFTISKKGDDITFRVHGDGFLYKQVRSMVGILLRIGQGGEAPELVKKLLEQKSERTARVPTAPPHGLFLWKVQYAHHAKPRPPRDLVE